MTDSELMDGARELARTEGIFAAPESGACVPALRSLLARGEVKPEEKVLLFNTASGIKYVDAFDKKLTARTPKGQPSALGPALRQ